MRWAYAHPLLQPSAADGPTGPLSLRYQSSPSVQSKDFLNSLDCQSLTVRQALNTMHINAPDHKFYV